jgi:hypothetical protein
VLTADEIVNGYSFRCKIALVLNGRKSHATSLVFTSAKAPLVGELIRLWL